MPVLHNERFAKKAGGEPLQAQPEVLVRGLPAGLAAQRLMEVLDRAAVFFLPISSGLPDSEPYRNCQVYRS